jgi:hypothetical protein
MSIWYLICGDLFLNVRNVILDLMLLMMGRNVNEWNIEELIVRRGDGE